MAIAIRVNPTRPTAGGRVCVTVSGSPSPPSRVQVSIDGGPPRVFARQGEGESDSWSFCFDVPAGASIAMISASVGPHYEEKFITF